MDQLMENNQFPLSRYLISKSGQRGNPIMGVFELTTRCNFDCKMCYVHSQNNSKDLKEKELSVQQWLKIAAEAKEEGMLFLLLTGGEAMLREDFIQLYSQLAVMGFYITINSNGSLLSDDIIDCFRKYPPTRVNISLYGASNETYDALCGNRAFHKVKKSIHTLKSLGMSVRITMTLTPYNIDDMEEVYRIAKEEDTICEMTSYMFPPVRVNNCYGDNQARLSSQDAGIYMARRDKLLMGEEKFYRYLKNLENRQPIKHQENVEQGYPVSCQAGRASFWITWDGKMKPCGLMANQEVDVMKNGFSFAWKNIHQSTQKIRLPKECVSCDKQVTCQQCASVCQSETGRFDGKPTYMCELVEAKLKEYERIKAEYESQKDQ